MMSSYFFPLPLSNKLEMRVDRFEIAMQQKLQIDPYRETLRAARAAECLYNQYITREYLYITLINQYDSVIFRVNSFRVLLKNFNVIKILLIYNTSSELLYDILVTQKTLSTLTWYKFNFVSFLLYSNIHALRKLC